MYDYTMARTNIDIDERLIGVVMRRYHLRTKREAVDFALRRLVGSAPATEDILGLEGSGWQGDLTAMRASRAPDDL
ncbi:MAG TPA: type II toxin-antitoxin system VapB family antitoxin [Candidatus Dormibacteraeota bacterium]|nr:type II toxin-antitoxin system VapB family antitoxin [Candidatus Dormibacteraeota bacterium]